MENSDVKTNLIQAASNHVGDVIYTVAFDVANAFIEHGISEDVVLPLVNSVLNTYFENDIKVRKKPAPRQKKSSPAKISISNALSKNENKDIKKHIIWILHPSSTGYSYTTSVSLATGYPLKLNSTGKIVGIIDDDDTHKLTVQDAKIGLSMGLDIDFSQVG